jgi:hypothetical protein
MSVPGECEHSGPVRAPKKQNGSFLEISWNDFGCVQLIYVDSIPN